MTQPTTPPDSAVRRPSGSVILFLMIVAFLSTVGMGIVMPVLPFLVRQYVADQAQLATALGWLGSAYAICQFVAAPGLGALSDRYGRRPVLLVCLLGSALGYALFGLGGALWVLFTGRIIDGLTGANFSILAAYIADVTPPEQRSRYFGMFGATGGAGFIIGPALGGLLARFGYSVPAYVAAGVTLLSLVWGLLLLPESLAKEQRAGTFDLGGLNLFKQLAAGFAIARLRWLLVATFCFSLPFAVMQSNLSVLVIDRLHWDADTMGGLFLIIGTLDIVMQGVLVGRLLPIFGEVRLTLAGLICELCAYVLFGSIALVASPLLLYAGAALYAIGTGFREPAARGLVSQAAGPQQQGVVQGSSQSVQSLAMVLGPVLGGTLYTQAGQGSPYWLGACVMGLAVLAVLAAVPALRAAPAAQPAEAAA